MLQAGRRCEASGDADEKVPIVKEDNRNQLRRSKSGSMIAKTACEADNQE